MSLLALGLALSAGTASSDVAPALWRDLRLGMTKSEVRALLPTRRVSVGDGCYVVVKPRYADGRVSRVDLRQSVYDKVDGCGQRIQQTLIATYGAPTINSISAERPNCGVYGLTDLSDAVTTLCKVVTHNKRDRYAEQLWQRDAVEISFRMRKNVRDPKWWASYRPLAVPATALAARF